MTRESNSILSDCKNPFQLLEEMARKYMASNGVIFSGNFEDTLEGAPPITFNKDGEEGRGKKKTAWLFCRIECEPKPSLRVSFGCHNIINDQTGHNLKITKKFTLGEDVQFSDEEAQKEYERRVEAALQKEKKVKEQKRKSRDYCLKLLEGSEPPGHTTYTKKKGLKQLGEIRISYETDLDENLCDKIVMIPLSNMQGEIQALQKIYPRKKMFSNADEKPRDKTIIGSYSGCFFAFGSLERAKVIRIAEGYATASTIFSLTRDTTLSCISCSNMEAVGEKIRGRYPEVEIIFCADNDQFTNGNPGLTAAKTAAVKVKGKICYPKFSSTNLNEKLTDFNDLFLLEGDDSAIFQLEDFDCAEDIQSKEEKEKVFFEKCLGEQEYGDARLFVSLHGENYLFDPTFGREGSFFRYNEKSGCWEEDKKKQRYIDFEDISKAYKAHSDRVADCKSQELEKRANQLLKHGKRKAVLETVSALLTFPSEKGWDRLIDELPCKNGVVNLMTGRLRKAEPVDFITKVCPVEFDPQAKCPMFENFLNDITLHRVELERFLQVLFGYALLGNPVEHILIYFYGRLGRNGKGTLLRIIEKILGQIVKMCNSSMILKQSFTKDASSPDPSLAALEGVRMAIFSEIEENAIVDSAKIKNLTGGDTISCRRLYSNVDLQIIPTFTIIIQTNYTPKAPPQDKAFWKRMIVVPFDAEFIEDPDPTLYYQKKIDPYLEKNILGSPQERAGVLNWLLGGVRRYQEEGLKIPPIVLNEVRAYQIQNDAIVLFLEECCEIDPTFSAKGGDAYKSISKYSQDNGLLKPNKNQITAVLSEKFGKSTRSGGNLVYKGFRILEKYLDN